MALTRTYHRLGLEANVRPVSGPQAVARERRIARPNSEATIWDSKGQLPAHNGDG